VHLRLFHAASVVSNVHETVMVFGQFLILLSQLIERSGISPQPVSNPQSADHAYQYREE
jgi:hypothetical protein